MDYNTDAYHAFFNGQDCYKNKDYVNARNWFLISLKHPNFKDDSLSKLVQINIKEGKYSQAREILELNKDSSSLKLKQTYGLLENVENNFHQSMKYYYECMIDPYTQYRSLLAIARLHIQMGNYEIAKKMLETLKFNSKFYFQAILELVIINIYEHKYHEAQEIMSELDESTMSMQLKKRYQLIVMYINYFLGQLKKPDKEYDPNRDYMLYRLFDPSEETLINHIKKHCNQAEKNTNGCFFENINIEKLLHDSKEQIEDMNANHFGISDIYRFRFSTPIGYKGDLITNDLCVVTTIGTKDIITMYPILLSKEFDKEGLLMSKELKYKRLQGVDKK